MTVSADLLGDGRPGRRMAGAATAALVAVLAAAAFRVDQATPAQGWPWLPWVDVAVGVSYAVAAAARWLPGVTKVAMALTGSAWLAASLWPRLQPVHRGMLLLACISLAVGPWPDGWFGTRRAHVALAVGGSLAVTVALGWVARPVAAGFFAAVAGLSMGRGPRRSVGRLLVGVAALAVAVDLGASTAAEGLRPGVVEPRVELVVYEIVLVAVAGLLVVGAQLDRPVAVVERALDDVLTIGLEGLASVLGDLLGDPTLTVTRTTHDVACPVPGRAVHGVDDGGVSVAVISHRPGVLADPSTTAAIDVAVRLVVRHADLLDLERRQLSELVASRARLLSAEDRARAVVTRQLRIVVDVPLARAIYELGKGPAPLVLPANLLDELVAARDEIVALVGGLPAGGLGEGRLIPALTALAESAPLPVTLTVGPAVAADSATESVLYFVCAEGITNVVKHADAATVVISLVMDGGEALLQVSDDGRGGADPGGSGLIGLADRLAVLDGFLTVTERPGRGTVLTARVPLKKPLSRV